MCPGPPRTENKQHCDPTIFCVGLDSLESFNLLDFPKFSNEVFFPWEDICTLLHRKLAFVPFNAGEHWLSECMKVLFNETNSTKS